jgi:monofunctional biosynthetic peptidoglycan transglycosylase
VRQFHEDEKMTDATMKPVEQRVVFGFDDRDSRGEWTSVNDDVMGGVSEGGLSITEKGVLEFTGVVSLENNGGFASIRSRPDKHDLSECDGLLLRVRGDGHRYACNIRTDRPVASGSYRQPFETKTNEWQEIALPFRDFVATSHGQIMRDAPDLDIEKIRSFGFTISDKQAGPFKLEVDWVKAVKMPSESIVETDSAKVGCATCVFHMKGVEGCKLAVEIDSRHYLVEGSDIDDHGDAHAADGLCNTARSAEVKGKILGGRFVAEECHVLPLRVDVDKG